ncbi:MAG: 50S ribosomal protein L35 [Minisyncoccia bacterium]
MPKIKTHKGLAKRIKVTKRGKFQKRRAQCSHLREKKSSKRKRKYARLEILNKSDKKKIKRIINK